MAPEWLDLKDVIFAQETNQRQVENITKSVPLFEMNTDEISAKINKFICLVDEPEFLRAPGAILFYLLWYGYQVLMYLGFLISWFFAFFIVNSLVKKHIIIVHISQSYSKSSLLLKLLLSFMVVCLFWYGLNKI